MVELLPPRAVTWRSLVTIIVIIAHGHAHARTPKSRGSASDVPLPAALEKRLLELLRAGYRENLSGYLFANRNGNPYSIGKVTEYGLWPVLEKLKIERGAARSPSRRRERIA
jgi:hypothetical protein